MAQRVISALRLVNYDATGLVQVCRSLLESFKTWPCSARRGCSLPGLHVVGGYLVCVDVPNEESLRSKWSLLRRRHLSLSFFRSGTLTAHAEYACIYIKSALS